MGAVTVTKSRQSVEGDRRVVYAKINAPAHNDTWVTGLQSVDHVDIVQVEQPDATYAAIGYTASGGTVTFVLRGTAKKLSVRAVGS